ncbi:hypothetical protein GCK72_009099 [Caenorhabditis remanei]|uniref:Uncharacterized protein n=1 Tax=Caenorhabditis remanei TaxID=31234 RepID=A0A6A5GZD2_CAERE|nr:hypothetical protein GCK72_009099 [Caenorhabditis remanei]KAF1760848.1 hypothetical protein GCK72_009099 [Caenorhabditis remanei]
MLPYSGNTERRQQAVTRTHHHLHQNYQSLPRHRPRPQHGCHVFCRECFNRIFLGSLAFKLYLVVAWCLGLTARAVYTTICLIYLLSQNAGLLGVFTQNERIFIPYAIVLVVTIVANTILISLSMVLMIAKYLAFISITQGFLWDHPILVFLGSIVFFVYNGLCLASMIHLCSDFDKKRILTERRQREEAAHRARIYNRLVELNNRDQPITVNLDSPPKYSNLSTKSETVCTPPPGYSQLKDLDQKSEKSEKTSQRALFLDSSE